jgi:hypothetical protein
MTKGGAQVPFEFAPVPLWLVKRPEVSSSAKVLYGVLLRCAGSADAVEHWSLRRLGIATGRSRDSVKLRLRELRDWALIDLDPGMGRRPSRVTFLAHAWIPEGENLPLLGGGAGEKPPPQRGKILPVRGGKNAPSISKETLKDDEKEARPRSGRLEAKEPKPPSAAPLSHSEEVNGSCVGSSTDVGALENAPAPGESGNPDLAALLEGLTRHLAMP